MTFNEDVVPMSYFTKLFLFLVLCNQIFAMDVIKDGCENKKITPEGKYCYYPGVTVISFVGSTNEALWKQVFESLDKSLYLKKYIALLPQNSYHVTTINLYTKKGIKEDWKKFIDQNLSWFQKLNEKHRVFNNLKVRGLIPKVGGQTIRLTVKLEAEDEKKILSMAKDFRLEKNVPDEFHITLGYSFKNMRGPEKSKIQIELNTLLNNIIDTYVEPITLDPPQLTLFNNMTDFIPWDGSKNPF